MENCIDSTGDSEIVLDDTGRKWLIGNRKAGDAAVLIVLLLGFRLFSAFDSSPVSLMRENRRSETIVENTGNRELLKLNLGVHAQMVETPDLLEIAASIEVTKCSSKKLQREEILEDGQTAISAGEFVEITVPNAEVSEAIAPEAEAMESILPGLGASKENIVTENTTLPDGDITIGDTIASGGNILPEDTVISEENNVTEEIDGNDGNSVPGFIIVPDENTGMGDEVLPDEDRVMDSESDEADETDDVVEEEIIADNGFLIDEAGMIYGIDAETLVVTDGYLELPAEGCIGIKKEAFSEMGAEIVEVYIPSNISIIEEGAFSNLYQLEWIEAGGGNTGYMSIDGVLFDGSGTTLLAFPSGRTDSYAVPEGVVRIADGAFANTVISCLDLWRCNLVEMGANIFGGHSGNGIEIIVPAESIDWYQNLFTGYDVRIS